MGNGGQKWLCDLCPNSHKHSTMKLDLNSYLPSPDHVTFLNESTRTINQSPCARGPPSAIAFKESQSNGRSPATPPFLLSSLGCVHAVCLIHSWLSATAYINKRGKPLWRILVPKWSNLSSEIIVWNCLCQLPRFCSVLRDLLATEGKVPHILSSSPGQGVQVTDCATCSLRVPHVVRHNPAEHLENYGVLSVGWILLQTFSLINPLRVL